MNVSRARTHNGGWQEMGTGQGDEARSIWLRLVLIVALISMTGYLLVGSRRVEQDRHATRPSEPALDNRNASSCAGIKDPVNRDICLWDGAAQQALLLPLPQETDCADISDTVLQYLCIRLFYRPHMAQFMPHRDTLGWKEPFDAGSECTSGEAHERALCTLLTLDKDIEAPETTCEGFMEPMRTACMFFVATSLMMSSSSQEELIRRLQGFCPKIPDGAWRSECHYLLADELASARPVGDMSVIVKACEASHDADIWDFHCAGHVVQLMPSEDGKVFCREIRSGLQESCWRGWGRESARQTEGRGEPCLNLDSRWRRSCEEGVEEFLTEDSPPRLEEGIEYGPVMK